MTRINLLTTLVQRSFYRSIQSQAPVDCFKPILPRVLDVHAESISFPASLQAPGPLGSTLRLRYSYAADSQKWNVAWSLYNEMKEGGKLNELSVPDYARLMEAVMTFRIVNLSKKDRTEVMQGLYNDMKGAGLFPDSTIQLLMLESYAKSGKVAKVMQIAEKGQLPCAVVYVRMAVAHILAGSLNTDYIESLKTKAVKEIKRILEVQIRSGKIISIPRAGPLFEKRVQTLAIHQVYNPILAALCDAKEEERMVEFFEHLPEMFTFSHMIRYYSVAKRFEEAEKYIDLLESTVTVRSMKAFTPYLLSLSEDKNYEKAYKFIQEKKHAKFTHCKASLMVELECLARLPHITKSTKLHSAMFALLTMASKKSSFTMEMYSDIANIFGPEAKYLFESDEEGDDMLSIYFSHHEIEQDDFDDKAALKRREEIKAEKHDTYSESASQLIRAYSYMGDVKGAQKLLEYAIKSELTLDPGCYESFIMACYHEADPEWRKHGDAVYEKLTTEMGHIPSVSFLNYIKSPK